MTAGARPRLAHSLVLAAVLSGLGVVRAQDADDDEPEAAPAPAVVRQHFMVSDQSFESGVFGSLRTAAAARAQFGQSFSLRADEIEHACGLNETQKEKLLLAARGDMKRFFDRVEEKRKEFQLARTDPHKYQEFFQGLAPIRQAIAKGLFGDGSLFSKTIRSTLDPGQAARYEVVLRSRQGFREGARLELVLAVLDNALGLDAGQRRKLRKLAREETRPPKSFGYYDYQVLILQLARLPEETLKPIFREAQWRTLTTWFDNAKRMEPFLNQNGYLPDPAAPVYDPAPGRDTPGGAKPR